jgi:hypothetical protein
LAREGEVLREVLQGAPQKLLQEPAQKLQKLALWLQARAWARLWALSEAQLLCVAHCSHAPAR